MKQRGWFYPLRSGSFSAEFQQKLRRNSVSQVVFSLRSVFFSAEIQQDMTHSSEGKTNLGFSFFLFFLFSWIFFSLGLFFQKE